MVSTLADTRSYQGYHSWTAPHTAPHPLPSPFAPPPAAPASTMNGPAGIFPRYEVNGRIYQGIEDGKYLLFPCDELEKDRMDIYHKLFHVARKGKHFSAPLRTNWDAGPRILDMGTGTGIWAMDVAAEISLAEVQGIDISLIQPTNLPDNVSFSQHNIESHWYWLDQDAWDLIHIRMLNGGVREWQKVYNQAFRHLKPDFGWIEHVEIDILPRCEDGSLELTSALNSWSRFILDATNRNERPLAYNEDTRAMLQQAGFVDIQEQVIQIPLNPWPADPHMKEVGRWYNLGLTQGLEALTVAPLTQLSNWKITEVNKLVANTKREICAKKKHVYNNIHVWIARRPLG